jgi:CheY-like chemotaxis protein
VDGETGTQLALDQRPDLILLDLHMPRMDGFTALAKLAQSPVRSVPVIVCTSRALSAEQKRTLAPAYAIVPKHELSRDSLAALMQSVLGASPAAQRVGAP